MNAGAPRSGVARFLLPGILLASLFMGYVVAWSLLNPGKIPPADARSSFVQKLVASRSLIPIVLLIAAVLGAIYAGVATATEAAALGVGGDLVAHQRHADEVGDALLLDQPHRLQRVPLGHQHQLAAQGEALQQHRHLAGDVE